MTRSLKYLGSATRRTAAGAALTALACSSVSGPEREGDGPLGLKYDITTETGMLLAIQDEAFLSQAMGNSSVRRTSAALTISNGPRHYGDVNGSGEVDIVDALLHHYEHGPAAMQHVNSYELPSTEAVARIVSQARALVFPGWVGSSLARTTRRLST